MQLTGIPNWSMPGVALTGGLLEPDAFAQDGSGARNSCSDSLAGTPLPSPSCCVLQERLISKPAGDRLAPGLESGCFWSSLVLVWFWFN
jgi:hypothetical protein